MTMIKRIFASVILGIILFTGENAMAETALNAGQKSIAAAASYAARGKPALPSTNLRKFWYRFMLIAAFRGV